MATDDDAGHIVPLHAEEISVTRKLVERGTVRVRTITTTHDVLVDEVLTDETVCIDRVAVGQFVDVMPQPREDGDTTIIPVVEEVITVTRRLFLKEEVRVKRVTTARRHLETVTLRREDAVIERDFAPGEAGITPDTITTTTTKPGGSHGY